MRYEIRYRNAQGRAQVRIAFADDPSEIRRLISAEKLRSPVVLPPLDGPVPPASAQASPAPLEVEIISRPSDLRADRTGGKLPWMEADEDAERRKEAQSASRRRSAAESYARARTMCRGQALVWERLESAVRSNAIELGRHYSLAELKAIFRSTSMDFEKLSMDLVGRSQLRLTHLSCGDFVVTMANATKLAA